MWPAGACTAVVRWATKRAARAGSAGGRTRGTSSTAAGGRCARASSQSEGATGRSVESGRRRAWAGRAGADKKAECLMAWRM